MQRKNQDWHAEDIKAAVRKRGTTLSQLSRDAGLKSDSLRNVLRFHCKKYEAIVAGVIGVEPGEIWPSRYSQGAGSQGGLHD
ncbi:helix-turn-helix domain-containing protein [Edwardsiella tarda]|uniref:helix-turn-helix domain-containing protein n=1 Tax=Edwardsiella tarda TaxID=636 RepID=UPI0008FAD9EA|nr:helix-turn-helix domain-containing protein [Edwardsiella tarda]